MVMEKIIDKKCYRTDVFEPVTEVPFGYSVWAIGRENFQHERCIPLAKEFDEKYHINLSCLKYIMVDTEDLALAILEEAVRHGVDRDKFLKMVGNNTKED
jgi:hypothetical protein